MSNSKFLIVTGLSGAGKTEAIRSLEDLGYFCVDNLPPALILKFAELCKQSKGRVDRIALVVDIRGGEFFEKVFESLSELDNLGIRYEILFLEASNETLVRRFKESRRRHPLALKGETLKGIEEERKLLRELRGRAHKVIDTSNLKPIQLKNEIISIFDVDTSASRFYITIMSFGYKYGIPLDSDLVIDVRFLPNPHYVTNLRYLTGNDAPVRDYVFGSDVTGEFMDKLGDLLKFCIPHYIQEGKSTLTIAIGCTGGMHRSVALANRIGETLLNNEYRVTVRHRDVNLLQRSNDGGGR